MCVLHRVWLLFSLGMMGREVGCIPHRGMERLLFCISSLALCVGVFDCFARSLSPPPRRSFDLLLSRLIGRRDPEEYLDDRAYGMREDGDRQARRQDVPGAVYQGKPCFRTCNNLFLLNFVVLGIFSRYPDFLTCCPTRQWDLYMVLSVFGLGLCILHVCVCAGRGGGGGGVFVKSLCRVAR